MKAQGSTEYLVLLGIALVVALVAVGLLAYYPGTTEDAKKTQSDLYWSRAYPIAILEANGYGAHHQIAVKNLAPQRIIIRGIDVENRTATSIDYSGSTCTEASLRNCSISLAPGREIVLDYDAFSAYEGWVGMPLAACGLIERDGSHYAAMNSYKKLAEAANLRIYYSFSLDGAMQAQSGSEPLVISCRDYGWLCSVDQDCDNKYGGTLRTCELEGYCSVAN